MPNYLNEKLAQALWMTAPDKSNVNFGYGQRYGQPSYKGLGFLGAVPNPNVGESTEISTFNDLARGPYPLMVPTLNRNQLTGLLAGNPDQDTYTKAMQHAELRKMLGLSPFAGVGEQGGLLGD